MVTVCKLTTGYDHIRSGITREKAGSLPFSLVENDVYESKEFHSDLMDTRRIRAK